MSHSEPERGNKPELNDAQRILADEAARREAMFQQSVSAEKTRGDALSRRFEEALKQAKQEPITRPARDFDLDWNLDRRFGDWVIASLDAQSIIELPNYSITKFLG